MSDTWQDKEAAEEIVSRLTSADAILLLTVRMEVIEKKTDGSVTLTMKYYDMVDSIYRDVNNPELPYDAAEVLAHYNSGDILVLLNADLDLVNTVRTDVGLEPEDESIIGASGMLDAYGLSCQRENGLRNLFTYVVPTIGDLLSSDVVDDSTETLPYPEDNDEELPDNVDSEEEEKPADTTQDEYTLRDFQIDRWVHFIQWMTQLGVMARRNEATAAAYEVWAAANEELTKIADAQTNTFNFCYPSFNTNQGLGKNTVTVSRCRDSFVSVIIYAAHSFTNGKDYYLVESTTTTSPKNYRDVMVEFEDKNDHYYKANIVYGYTKAVDTEFNIDGGGMSTSDVSLLRHEPANVNASTTYTEGMQWDINGTIGVSKDGPSAQVGGGVSFSKSTSWSVSEYDLINESMKEHPASAKWWADFQNPNDTSENNYVRPFVYWDGVSAKSASRNQLKYTSYFLWEVSKNYWQKHPNMTLRVKFNVKDGITMGWCRNFYAHFNRWDYSTSWCKRQSLKLTQPSHMGVDKTKFALTSVNPSQPAFTLYTEDSWTMKNIPSWVHFSETSGSATGSGGKLIVFDVDNNTTGNPRTGGITISSGRDTLKIEVGQSR